MLEFWLMRETPENSGIYIDETDGPFEATADEAAKIAQARSEVDGSRFAFRINDTRQG